MRHLRRTAFLVTVMWLASHAAAQESVELITRAFDDEPVGRAPHGFRFVESRDAAPNRWAVQKDGPDIALLHAGGPSSHAGGLALALVAQPELQELTMSARVKLRGQEQAAGLVWRYQDPDNYYLVQLQFDEQSIGFYRMVNGNRVLVEEEDDLELDRTAWHTVRIRQGDEGVRVYLGGIRVFEAHDRILRDTGSFGVWASGATTALFDDLRVEPRVPRRRGH